MRYVVKTSTTTGEIPTVPATDDHQDGSWLATDIYKGEFFFNRVDGIMYSRDDNGIFIVGEQATLIYEAFVTQTGTSAPTVVVKRNTIGSIVWSYSNVGQYVGTLSGAFPSAQCAFIASTPPNNCGLAQLFRINNNTIGLESRNNLNASTNGLLTDFYIKIMILP